MTPFPWECPFCHRTTTINHTNHSEKHHLFENGNHFGPLDLVSSTIICPNPDCREVTIVAFLQNAGKNGHQLSPLPEPTTIQTWTLRPSSNAKQFPDYVPASIRQDYEEAASILDLSPKAAATLARRCIQGMIRDFWNIKKSRLIDEINVLKEKVDPITWEAIDSVRKIGNIGAHMENDINLIVDVDPRESRMLLSLIEMLITEWYIHREERSKQLKNISQIAAEKDEIKKGKQKPG